MTAKEREYFSQYGNLMQSDYKNVLDIQRRLGPNFLTTIDIDKLWREYSSLSSVSFMSISDNTVTGFINWIHEEVELWSDIKKKMMIA